MTQKIGMLLPDLGGGGAERVFLLLAKQFLNLGIQVELILMKKHGAYLSEIPENVKVITLCSGRGEGLCTREVGIAFMRMVRYLNQTPIDVLLSTLSRTNLFSIASARLSSNNCRVVIREANTFYNVSSKLQRGLMSWLYPKADHIIAISKGVAKDIQSFKGVNAKNVRVIYNPIDIEKTQNLSEKTTKHS